MAAHRWPSITLGAVTIGVIAYLLNYFLTLYNYVPDLPTDPLAPKFNATGQSRICISLAEAVPGTIYSDEHPSFRASIESYWSANARESIPGCIFKPVDTQNVAVAIKIVRGTWDATPALEREFVFAVRSGGHSPENGFAGIHGGVLFDLSLMNNITVSIDKQTVRVGMGARWREVYSYLGEMGLGMVGGRNGNVGVGGLVLGGGISFFSPRYGMVCDNIDEYELVLANGTIIQVTASQHPDLWKALKGGTGNFGIVTSVVAKTFVSGDIWAGYGIWPLWQSPKIIKAFYEFNRPENFDPFAAGPILAMGYTQPLRLNIVACSLVYSKPQAWPPVFAGFKAPWRLWSTTKIQSLNSAAHELHLLSPAGSRQFQATLTIRNDLETLYAIESVYKQKLPEIKHVKGLILSVVFQPLSAAVMRKGSPNVLGLESRSADETLVVVLLTVAHANRGDDALVQRVSREILALSEDVARKKGTLDDYIYLNYAASGQDPFAGYGAENQAYLKRVGLEYDPEGFYQRAKQGGFKIGVV